MGDKARFDYDAIVIGTGFGGSVAAARLTQAGARVLVLERGMRYSGEAFPALPRDGQALADPARFVWSSEEGRLGLWDVRDLGATHAASAAGYGGGSLIYASVHLRAPDEVFEAWPKTPGHAYSRAALDPYYDLAAHMLEVDTIESAAPKLYPLRKASALRAAAQQLGRGRQTFSPPLAVRFHEGTDILGNERGACVGCGECDSGCRHGAKNSLEHNYLAIAERMRRRDVERPGFPIGRALRADEPLAIIRTLAEARAITRIELEGGPGYAVELWDHTTIDHARISPLRGRKHGSSGQPPAEGRLDEVAGPRHERATARFVFLCAGAVGSTELLLRNRERLELHNEQLGQRYFGNSDALGIVRGAAHPQQPHVGPVITTALVHRGKNAEEPWLMIQDGGYGQAVHALVEAVFASPVLGQRNRFYERAVQGIAPAHLDEGPSSAQPFVEAPLPVRPNASLAEGLYRTEIAHELIEIIPGQLADAAAKLRQQVEGFVAQDVEKTVDALEQFVVRGGARRLARWAEGMTGHERVERAAQRLLTWIARLIRWMTADGALAEIARLAEDAPSTRLPKEREQLAAFARANPIGVATMLVMKERFKLTDQRAAFVEGLKLLTRRASDAATYQKSMDHTAVLLTMGRDQQRHRLHLVKGALQAEMARRELGEQRLYSVQERLMREVASVLGGELRLNPAWSQAHTPITVHGQGGCAMSDDPSRGVTDPCGEVYGCKGLFVMDGALFPSPVGVNPSATILAVAERNIEAFIRKQPELGGFTAPEAAAARNIDAARRARLTPAAIDSIIPSPDIETPAAGIRFEERMYGFHASTRNAALDGTRHTERLYSEHEACYIDGRVAGDSLELVLDAVVEDLPAFISDPSHRGTLKGKLVLKSHDSASASLNERLRELLNAAGGELTVREGTIDVMSRLNADERLFRYSLRFDVPVAGCLGLMLEGHKRVRDEPGQDEWQDTTALFFCLAEIASLDEDGRPVASHTARSHGVVRVSVDEFLNKQLPSMQVIGVRPAPNPTDEHSEAIDPATVMWSLATFGTFFFGNLADVYLKEAALVTRVVKRSLSLGGTP